MLRNRVTQPWLSTRIRPRPPSPIFSSRFGPRHFASNQVYSPSLRATCRRVAARLGMADSLREGVYIQMAGPQFESVAELKMLKAIGVDAVGEGGRQTVVIFRVLISSHVLPSHCHVRNEHGSRGAHGAPVRHDRLRLSLISNECILSDDVEEGPTAEEVIESGERRDGAGARDSRHFRKLIQYRERHLGKLLNFV